MMVSTMSEDYVLTAEAKGLRPGRIRDRYAARNAPIPSLAGLQHRARLRRRRLDRDRAGVQLPGHRQADDPEVQGLDYALMQGVFLVITLTVLAANFLMDLFYGLIDPRVRSHG